MYQDAIFAKNLIDNGKLKVENVSRPASDVLMHYKLGKGERDAITLGLQMNAKIDFLVTDDRLAFVVCERIGIAKSLFLDLIVNLTQRNLLNKERAISIVHAVKSRYHEGFLYHTLTMLEQEQKHG